MGFLLIKELRFPRKRFFLFSSRIWGNLVFLYETMAFHKRSVIQLVHIYRTIGIFFLLKICFKKPGTDSVSAIIFAHIKEKRIFGGSGVFRWKWSICFFIS